MRHPVVPALPLALKRYIAVAAGMAARSARRGPPGDAVRRPQRRGACHLRGGALASCAPAACRPRARACAHGCRVATASGSAPPMQRSCWCSSPGTSTERASRPRVSKSRVSKYGHGRYGHGVINEELLSKVRARARLCVAWWVSVAANVSRICFGAQVPNAKVVSNLGAGYEFIDAAAVLARGMSLGWSRGLPKTHSLRTPLREPNRGRRASTQHPPPRASCDSLQL